MVRILHNGEWYTPLSSRAHYENEYERLIFDHASALFPDYVAVPFKSAISSEHGEGKSDFALIDRRYRKWWVCEVELAHHSRSHVLHQASIFATGVYTDVHAGSLHQAMPNLNILSLQSMMKGANPGVLFIVDSPELGWKEDLKLWGCTLMIVEVFRSDRNRSLLRINGSYPHAMEEHVLTTCRVDPIIPRLVLLESPGALSEMTSDLIRVSYEGALTEWSLVHARDRVWLSPARTNPLPPGVSFELTQGVGGELSLRPRSK